MVFVNLELQKPYTMNKETIDINPVLKPAFEFFHHEFK